MIDHTRHMGIFTANNIDVCLIGAGGIGAITAITLGKMGVFHLWVYDFDHVDEINLATQFFCKSDVGLEKALAVGKLVERFSDTSVQPRALKIDKNSGVPAADIYISAVDSIAARQEIWQVVKSIKPEGKIWYLDARMGAEVFELFVVDLESFDWYDAGIIKANDSDIPDLPCTSKATIYTANIAAGHIGAGVRQIITGRQKPGFLAHNILDNQISYLEM